jgi:hypothetical protein
MATFENNPVEASDTLGKASDAASDAQLNVATTAVPDGYQFPDDCPGTNMMFEDLKESFHSMRSAFDSGKPSEAADSQDKVQQADAWFFACRHDLATRFAELGGDARTLQTMHVPG